MAQSAPRLLAALLACALAPAAHAADAVRVGYAAQSPSFMAPIDAAQEQGYFAKAGIDVTSTTYGGGAKLATAMMAGGEDIALATGTDFSYPVKGAPEIAVGVLVNEPFSIAVSSLKPEIRKADDLKGKIIGVTAAGSYTYWFVSQLPHFQNWPAGNEAKPVGIGGALNQQLAALTTGQIDAVVGDLTLPLTLQKEGKGHLVMDCADVVRDVVTSVIFAHNDMVKDRPEVLRRFVAATLQGVAFLRSHRAEQIALVTKETGLSPDIMGQYVDVTNPAWTSNGRITPKQLDATAPMLVQAGLLTEQPDLKPYYTEAFLPK